MLPLKEAILRWTEEILPEKETFLKAASRKKLTVYHGVDPTGPDLHLGHSTNYLLLRAFQDAGHKVILLIGDFTAQIGDPSDKTAARVRLTKEEISKNLKNYKKQAGKILRFEGSNPAKIAFNSKWLSKLSFQELIELAAEFTVQQMIERDIFQKRLAEKKPLYLHEFLYPLAQGYDSVAIKADVEVGGTDQTFNMLAGRSLVQRYLGKEKFVISTPLLINPKTGQKMMSKSLGSYISLQDAPDDMFGKIMALPDEVVPECFRLCTSVPLDETKNLGLLEAKKKLATVIVTMYHGEEKAEKAREEFESVFQRRGVPKNITVFHAKKERVDILEILSKTKLVKSKSEARRLVGQGGLEWNGKKITNPILEIGSGGVLKVGKHRFLKIKP